MMKSTPFIIFSLFILQICHSTVPDDDEDAIKDGKVIHEEILDELPYITPKPSGNYFLAETFDDITEYNKKWVVSRAKKDGANEDIAKYNGEWAVEAPEGDSNKKDLGLVLKSKAKHHAISAKFEKPYIFTGKPFILQYEVRFQNGQDCGGAYVKLLTEDPSMDLTQFHDKVPYTIMFGPDKCGSDSKLHFIFRHQNPKNGSVEEKHWKKSANIPKLDEIFSDKKPHLLSLILTPDDQFEIKVDYNVVQRGNLLQDFEPPVNPPAEIDDPNDFKPEDWDDRPKIVDPDDFKPDDWNEDAPKQILDMKAVKPSGWLDDEQDNIPNADAVKPEDWDDDMDGEWEPALIPNPKCKDAPGCGEWKRPMIDNPEYKGKWKPAMIDNPNYKGVWKPKRIPNPDFYEDKTPYYMMPIGAVGFELWSMSDGILFDNIIVTDKVSVAEKFSEDSFDLKKEKADAETDSVVTRLIRYSNKKPWLWGVYLLVVAVPVVLFITFCCNTSSSQEKRQTGEKKKREEPQADVIPEENEAENQDVENDEEEEEVDDDEQAAEDGEEQEEVEDEEATNEDVEASKPMLRTSPRRRKPRKD